jgi:hypothetical protein
MIKLTTVINSVPPVYRDIFVNPRHIVNFILSETGGGNIRTINGQIFVKETPEEIVALINQK